MNAADQRRLTPWLVAVCLLFVAALAALLLGFGSNVHWLPPGTAPTLPAARHPAETTDAPSLQHSAEIWQRPLFTTNRQPAPVATQGDTSADLNNLELTGVIMAPGMHIALLTDSSDGHTVRVIEGKSMEHGNWVLQTLKPREATFVDNGKVTRLQLKLPAGDEPAGAGSVSATAANPSGPGHGGTSRPPAPSRAAPAHEKRAPEGSADKARSTRIQTLKQRIEERRRQSAAHAGDH